MIEVKVPPKCHPILIGNHRQEGGVLQWVEKPSKKSTVISWGVDANLKDVVDDMIRLTLDRSETEGWEVPQTDLKSARKRMLSLGIEEVEMTDNLVHPTDKSLLGTIVIIGDKCFPVIHNANRALCVVNIP